ncbi:PaeR7I family type II restriction endonuclease [Halodesulfurarchaeum sp.]|uniref:PaeR7I family type II restriction endonuclease n=1 Tax=Halodesulfurarchaeum sp. TaxID=1980530 RepID=UPI002FC3A98E
MEILCRSSESLLTTHILKRPNDDEFEDATYLDRVELLCQRLVRKRIVNESAFLLSNEDSGLEGEYWQPNMELRIERFVRSLTSTTSRVSFIEPGTILTGRWISSEANANYWRVIPLRLSRKGR